MVLEVVLEQSEDIQVSPDHEKSEVFADRIAAALDNGALCLMLSIGHRTGLLDCMARLPASSSAAIAESAELSERYVREWLAAMVTGGVVTYDEKDKSYYLPPEHAASITRNGYLGNIAVYSQFLALMGQIQDRVLECFETGEGLQYSEYPCFHQIMAEDSKMTVVDGLFEYILPIVDGLKGDLECGIDVMDAGCGKGEALLALAQRFPASNFIGYDLSEEAIQAAQKQTQLRGLKNIHFEVRDLTFYDEKERFDLITSFDAVHDQKHPENIIQSFYRALKKGGRYLMQDIGASAYLENNFEFPLATFLYSVSCHHCMPVSLGQGGDGLGTMWGWETAEKMLKQAGFSDVAQHRLDHDPTNVWFVSKR